MSPTASPRLCTRCRKVVRGKCPTCSTGWERATTTTKRSPASTRRWRKVRAQVLAEEPLCRSCGTVLATEVDHIKPIAEGGDQWDRSNLQPLCHDCHRAKTAEESQRGRTRP